METSDKFKIMQPASLPFIYSQLKLALKQMTFHHPKWLLSSVYPADKSSKSANCGFQFSFKLREKSYHYPAFFQTVRFGDHPPVFSIRFQSQVSAFHEPSIAVGTSSNHRRKRRGNCARLGVLETARKMPIDPRCWYAKETTKESTWDLILRASGYLVSG